MSTFADANIPVKVGTKKEIGLSSDSIASD